MGYFEERLARRMAETGNSPKMRARIVDAHIGIRADYELPDCRCLETDCAGFDVYESLPRVVERDGVLFGLTGWNSDRGVAYYKSTAAMARVV